MRFWSGTLLYLFSCILSVSKATTHYQGSNSLDENKYSEQVNRAEKMTDKKERTFIMVKPDGVQRGLVPKILARFTDRGYKLIAMKMTQVTQDFAKQHYADLSKKPFFEGLTKFLSSGPVVATVWEGKDVVKQGRQMLGETNPLTSKPGSIRGDYCIDMGRNVIHGSDGVQSALTEISLWFKPEEIMDYKNEMDKWIYE